MSALDLTGRDLTLAAVLAYEDTRPVAALTADARERMQASVDTIDEVVATGRVSYGINTGFGAFANRRISREQVGQLQYNLVRSHAAGVGEPLAPVLVRRLMLLKANSLAAGYSGIRPGVVDTLLALLNGNVLPVIPCRGSVGASGDLAPLAHLALALIGEGEALHEGQRLEGEAVLAAVGREPVTLGAKEGLALLNGTQASAALAIEGLGRAARLLDVAVMAGALTVEGLAGSFRPFDARVSEARRMPGQIAVAKQFRSLLTTSEINRGHADCDRVQDPYAVRCMPQVLGGVRDTLAHAARVLEAECNAVSDNPLVFGDDVISGGNFHAEPLAFVSDFMAIATAELASMSERRIDLLVRKVNPHLQMFLTTVPGLESGMMIAHVTAAALASENKTLAHPASVDSIPTSAGQEDHVSMAPWAGLKLLRIALNASRVLAVELMSAALAIEAQRPLRTTAELERVYERVREIVPLQPGDHRLDREIAALSEAILAGALDSLLPLRPPLAS
jgi:histidine ammonia-lyase